MGDQQQSDDNDMDLMKDLPDKKLEDLERELSDEDKGEGS